MPLYPIVSIGKSAVLVDKEIVVLHEKHTPLSLEEALLALSVCAATNPLAAKAVKKLEMLAGCEAHSSHMLFKADENPMRKLGLHLTCEPEFLDNNLFIN